MAKNIDQCDTLPSDLRLHAESSQSPDNRPFQRITGNAVQRIARSRGTSQRQVEAAALGQGVTPARYSRNQGALSGEDQRCLLESTVAVIGLGGLGGTVAEILARVGVGRLILVDGDIFEESNLNRQLNCTTASIGNGKAYAAAARIAAVNPATETTVHDVFMNTGNAETLLAGADVAADCLDAIPVRFALAQAASVLGIPMVTAAVAGAAGQVAVIPPRGAGLGAIYGDPAQVPQKGVETVTGNLPYAVWAVAAVEAGEIVKVLLGRATLSGRLLLMDLDGPLFDVIDLSQ